jgi:hypothetical protein
MQNGFLKNPKSRGNSFPREIDRIEVAGSLWNEIMIAGKRANGIHGRKECCGMRESLKAP